VLRYPRFLVLGGYLVYAASTVVEWWPALHHSGTPRSLTAAQFAMVIAAGLFGWAWWSCLPVLSSAAATAGPVRRALWLFAAGAVLAAAASLVDFAKLGRTVRSDSLIVAAIGLLLAAVGFGWASWRVVDRSRDPVAVTGAASASAEG